MAFVKKATNGYLQNYYQLKDIEEVVATCHSLPIGKWYIAADYGRKIIRVELNLPIISTKYMVPFDMLAVSALDPASKSGYKTIYKLAIDEDNFQEFRLKFIKFREELKRELLEDCL